MRKLFTKWQWRLSPKLIMLFAFVTTLAGFSNNSNAQVAVGTGSTANVTRFPFSFWYGYSRDATIYTAAELNTVTIGDTITTLSWKSSIASTVTAPVVIYLKAVGSTTQFTSSTWASQIAGATQVYAGTPAGWAIGWNTIDITDFIVAAGQNVQVMVECAYGGSGGGGQTGTQFTYTTAGASTHSYWQKDTDPPILNQSDNGGAIDAQRPDIILGGLVNVGPGMVYASSTTTQASTSSVAPGGANQQMIRLAVSVTNSNNPLTVSQLDFSTGNTNLPADISNAKVYYTGESATFATTTQFGTAFNNPNGAFSITGSQALNGVGASSSTFYFWLTYDVICGIVNTNDSLDAVCNSFTITGGSQIPTVTNPAGTRVITLPTITYTATTSTTTIVGTPNFTLGRTNITGDNCNSVVTSVKYNTATSPAADIAQAKCYYTTSTTFNTDSLFGSAVVNPNGDITFNGSKTLAVGSGNYFWLTYDISCSAGTVNGVDSVTATPVSITTNAGVKTVATPATNAKKKVNAQTVPAYTATTSTTTVVGTANVTIGRITISGDNCNSVITSVKFNTSTSPAADIAQAKCYYTTGTTFNTDSLYGTPVVSPNGDITFNGSKTLAVGTGNNFWLVYDISCAAGTVTGVDSVVATPVSITSNSGVINVATPATNAKKKVNAQAVPAYTATASTTTSVGVANLTIGRISISGDNCNAVITSVKFNTSTSPAADIALARCYYTTGTTFNTDSLYGTPVVSPNGDITFNGSKVLAIGSGNNFWLTYDISCGSGSTVGVDSVVAIPVSITSNSGVISVATPTTNAKKKVNAQVPVYTATTTSSTPVNTQNLTIGRINITGDNCNATVTSVKYNTSTSPAADLSQARCYYTTGTTFNTDSLYGVPVLNPNGDITFNGSKTLALGSGNYFWLTYDIPCTAGTVAGTDSVVAIPVSITTNSGVISVATPATNNKKGITSPTAVTTIADGDWSSPSVWPCGILPVSTSNVIINHIITVTTSGNLAANLTINATKSLTISAGTLTMGAVNGDNKVFTNNGTLTISAGTFNVNGQFINSSTGTVNQSGGNINVDPNASGTGTSLTGSGTYPINWTITTAANLNLTGGVFTLVDPPSATAGPTYAVYMNYPPIGSVSAGPNHTFRFGDGVSTDAGSTTNGFIFYSWQGSGVFKFGKVILETNTANAASRFVNLNGTFFNFAATDDITIKSGAELRQVGTGLPGGVYAAKNLTVETGGTLTLPGNIYFGNVASTSATVLAGSASTDAQVVTGGGTFRNATTSPTANFALLSVNNSNASGVTFANANSLMSGANTGTVSGTFTLTAGKVNLGANTFTLGISAASTGTYTYTAGMVIGNFKRWLGASTGERAFDLGTGNVGRKVAINFTVAPTTGGSLTAKWTGGNPGANGLPLTEGSNTYTNTSENGYWTVSTGDGLTGGTYTASFTLTGGSDAPDFNTVTIGKRTTSSDPWALVGTAVAPTGTATNFTVSRTGVTGFSDFVLLLTLQPLDIKLASFTGRNAGAVNILNWTTVSEKDASHFDIMRSNDGNKFETLTTVNAKNVLSGSKYEFTDTKPFDGKNFYRLNMVDVDGKSIFSNVVVLSVKSSAGLSLVASPNPVEQKLNLTINGKIDGKATIHVVDITGKIVQKMDLTSNDSSIDMSNLSNGTYIIRYNDNSNSSVIKVTKN